MVSAGRVFALIDERTYEPLQEDGQAVVKRITSVLNMCFYMMETSDSDFLR